MKRKPKKFLSGGEVAGLAGLGYLGYKAYEEYQKGKKTSSDTKYDADESSRDPYKFSVDKQAPKVSKKENRHDEGLFKKHPEYFGGNPEDKPGGGGNVGTRTDTERPNSAARRTTEEIKSNVLNKRPEQVRVQTAPQSTETVQGVDEKKLDKLQRRDVGTGKKSTTNKATADKATADKAAADKRSSVMRQIRDQTYKAGTGKGQKTDSNPLAFGPRNTFITEESSKAANKSVGRARREQASKLFKGTEAEAKEFRERQLAPMKKGGAVKKYASGGSVSSASKRADGIAIRGKTRA